MSGIQGHFGLGVETTWGTAVAPTAFFEILSESLTEKIERFETRNIIGGLYEPDDQAGLHRSDGDVLFAAHPANFGHALKGAFGVNSISVVISGSLFTNVFTLAQTSTNSLHPLPAYTAEVYRPAATEISTAFRYSGVQVTALQFGVAPNQDLRVTGSLLAKTMAYAAKATPTFPSSPTGFFDFAATSIAIAAAAVSRVEAINIEIDNQLTGVPTLANTNEITRVRRNGPPTVRLSGTLEFESLADYEKFKDQTEQRVTISITRAASFQIIVDVPRAVFTELPIQIPGRERITADFSMMGRYHTGSGNAIKVTLTTTNTF